MTDNALPTVPHVELARYVGTWFEIWRLPLKWEDAGARDVTATYTPAQDGSIKVDNRCIDGEGKPAQSVGEAVVQDDTNARLKVSFLPEVLRWIPFTQGDYWIIRLDPDYRHALVGTPNRKHLWLLARDPVISAEVDEEYRAAAVNLGFDLSALIVPAQSGARVSDSLLAAADS